MRIWLFGILLVLWGNLLHPLIGFDVDQGTVDIEEQGANLHHGVRKMTLASSTNCRR